MSLPRVKTHQNGYHPASPDMGGAFVSSGEDDVRSNLERVYKQQRTVFPEDPPTLSLRTLVYRFIRYRWAGTSLFRWLKLLIILLALLALISGLVSWRVALASGSLLLLSLTFIQRRLATEDYVRFEPGPRPDLPTAQLDASEKIPVHVSGLFHVEDKEERHTWLPGFYRTFPTREHALLCLLNHGTFLRVGRIDPEQIGMWYIFFQPEEIRKVMWGTIYFGRHPRPCIAVDRSFVVPAQNRLSRDKLVEERVFMAFEDELDGQKIWADLLADTP